MTGWTPGGFAPDTWTRATTPSFRFPTPSALALLIPVDAPARFNTTAIEALAAGTPVIVSGHGAVAEIIDDGTTGFRVGSVGEATEAAGWVGGVRRKRCRRLFEQLLTAAHMSREYESLYRELVAERRQG